MAKKKTILDLYKMKKEGEKLSWITAYDFPMASFAEQAGIDMILVGDSLGMVVHGFNGTIPVTMHDCIRHCQAVRRGAPGTMIVGDMPFGSYQVSDSEAVQNAVRFLKEAGVLGGFRAQGRTVGSARDLIKDALAVQEAGAMMILLEAVPPELTAFITELLDIPVYSIGAGEPCDGQLTICGDILGMFQAFTPKFIKKYANLAEVCTQAIAQYIDEVKKSEFPTDDHVYHAKDPMPEFEAMFAEFRS